MFFMRAVLSKFRRKRIKLEENDLSPVEHNMQEINERVHTALNRVGKTRVELATMFGMDASIPLAMQPPEKIPRPTMENVVKLSVFLGVSVRWLLHGEPENDVDLFVMHHRPGGSTFMASSTTAEHGAAIITGANNSTVVVQNFKGENLNDMERAVIQAIRQLPPRAQASAMSYVFALEREEIEEKQKKAPSA